MKNGAAFASKVQADTVELTDRVRKCLEIDNAKLAGAEKATWGIALVAGFVTTVSGILIGLLLSRQILGGIAKIFARIGEVAMGNLSGEPLSHHVHDEIGATVESINAMQSSLRQMIEAVLASANHVARASTELSASSGQLLQNAIAQKTQSDQIVTAMHEMSSAMAEVGANASRAAEGATEARQVAHEGGQVVGTTVAAMQSLTPTTETTSRQIEGLSRSSDAIGKIVAVIDEIAAQTNLLALNASIEAARAGSRAGDSPSLQAKCAGSQSEPRRQHTRSAA
jgi:methyl-accepting chemotaxis protein